ncbi:MAG: V-type ATP synthase subunit A [Chloroflexota bacterium]
MSEAVKDDRSDEKPGAITRIAGPVVAASHLKDIRLSDVVRVGHLGLTGEVIRVDGDSRSAGDVTATIQVYEETTGIGIGDPVYKTGMPLVVHLGPGLLGSVYDGLQRPLEALADEGGAFIQRGAEAPPLPAEKMWSFKPTVTEGQWVNPGDVLGTVQETENLEHRIMVPPGKGGRVTTIHSGAARADDVVAVIDAQSNHGAKEVEITLTQRWPVRQPRPVRTWLDPREPLISGTRIIDALFPIAKGGSAIIPGGFGTGKTVMEHSLARWCDADVVVYVGCGERGNEMTSVLEEFPELDDPRTGAPLMARTVLIANTSNMPVAAREASIYTGITIAEYYRDMGYSVLLLADSTSRWGEALREISGRLEEMPGEEGYPAYLAARLAEFYERSGRAVCHGTNNTSSSEYRVGSVTIVGAVSPPGGDFSEPMTQNSMRVTGVFWALDYDLSRRRHFPAINWIRSYSLYDFDEWFNNQVAADFVELKVQAMTLLQRERELQEIVQLVGPDALPERERAELAVARVLREDFLQQSAFHDVDRYCSIEKSYWMLKTIMAFHGRTMKAIDAGVSLERISALSVVEELGRLKETPVERAVERAKTMLEKVHAGFDELGVRADV